MKKEVLKRIFEFLEKNGEHNAPFIWKLKNDIPLTKEDLNVKGSLFLSNIEITSLPEGLEVGGYLSLFASKITSLPKGLKVGSYLSLRDTNITSLPEGLEVGGDLFIIYSPLKKYTDKELREMIYPGFIKGKIFR